MLKNVIHIQTSVIHPIYLENVFKQTTFAQNKGKRRNPYIKKVGNYSIILFMKTFFISYLKKLRFLIVLLLMSTIGFAQVWQTVGTEGFVNISDYLDFDMYGSTPYITYKYPSGVGVMMFDGSSWINISPSPSSEQTNYNAIKVIGGIPYISYWDYSSKNFYVKKRDGSSWNIIKNVNTVAGGYKDIDLANIISNPIYVSCTSSILVQKYDGASWTSIYSSTDASNSTIGIGVDGSDCYVAHNVSGFVSVYKNGTLLGSSFSIGAASYIDLAMNGSTPYVAYSDNGDSKKVYVKKWNGTTWELVGGGAISAGQADYVSIALDGSTPYVAYSDHSIGQKATVKKLNGTIWENVGTGISTGSAYYTTLKFDGSTPYLAYYDGTYVTVKKFAEAPLRLMAQPIM